jgi:hypothetical protein
MVYPILSLILTAIHKAAWGELLRPLKRRPTLLEASQAWDELHKTAKTPVMQYTEKLIKVVGYHN